MSPELESLGERWRAVTSFDSGWVWLLVAGVAGGLGMVISWEVSELWERHFGYSSVLTALTTIAVFFITYFCLSYLVTAVLGSDTIGAK